MKVLNKRQIEAVLLELDLIPIIEAGFVAYSEGRAIVPPVGELLFADPPGDVHIKYGYIQGDPYYVIKIASGFYDNYKLGLPNSNGLMLLFNQQNGVLAAILLDEGVLTDVRTASAGAIAARYLAPTTVKCIGIVGAGIQARLQLQYLAAVTECRQVMVWGRRETALLSYQADMAAHGFTVTPTPTIEQLKEACNLIVTTTPATEPLLSGVIPAGTHITAVGSDTSHKQELHSTILAQADLVVADSISQCRQRGEIYQALQSGAIQESELTELGHIIAGRQTGRTNPDQITIADLTGVAVQDIQIARAVYERSAHQ